MVYRRFLFPPSVTQKSPPFQNRGEVDTDERWIQMRGGHRREAEWFRTPKEGWGGGGGGGVDAKKEGKGLEAVASIESKGWVPRDIR